MRLTDTAIHALKTPRKGAVIHYDDLLPGFGVRVSEGGTKSYILTYGPRRQRETIGRVGIIKLRDARIEARRLLVEHTSGKDKPAPICWDEAVKEFLTEKKHKLSPRTHDDYTYHLGKHFRYGPTKLMDLAPRDLWRNIDRLSRTRGEQRRAFEILRVFVNWAHRRHYFYRNPMERMQMPSRYTPRDRVLTNDELKRVWKAAGDDTFGKIVKLLILTGQRRGEITQLTGAMVGEDTITLPGALAKNGRKHTLPLGAAAKAILNRPIPSDAFVFPALGKATPFNGHSPCKRKLDKRCGVSDWTLHDLRRTFASGLASIGVSIPVIERLLNHVSGSFGGIVGVYQRYDFMPEMREAISRWEAHVAHLIES